MRRRKRESPDDVVAESQRLLRDASDEGKRARRALTEQAVAQFPKHALIRLEYASAMSHFDKDRAAAVALGAVALDTTTDVVLLTRAAMLLLSLGELAATRSCIDQAVLTQPANPVIVNQLAVVRGELALAEGDYESWERCLKAAHDRYPADATYALRLADAIIVNSEGARLPDALAVIEHALEAEPSEDAESRESRADLERQRERYRAVLSEATGRRGTGPVR